MTPPADPLVTARSFDEYVAMFDLRDADLEGVLLDCPGGAGSFASEVGARGGRVVSVDPVYALAPNELAGVVRADAELGNRHVAEHRDDFSWRFFPTVPHHDAVRLESAERFLDDLAAGGGRVAGALPLLPFPDRAFDLVLSGYFLFTYADQLDVGFHVDSVRELARVSAGEVRLFPLVDAAGRPYAHLDEVRGALAFVGLATERRAVPYDFQLESGRMLVVNPSPAP